MTATEWAMEGGDFSTLAGVKAGADLSAAANFGLVVKLDGSENIVLRGASGTAVGVLQNKPLQYAAACVIDFGPCEGQVDGSGTPITYDMELTVHATTSRLIAATTGDIVYAHSKGLSTAAADVISIFVDRPYKKSA